MAEEKQVTCINKEDRFNPNEAITHVGGGTLLAPWKMTRDEAIAFIERGGKLFVMVGGNRVGVIIGGATLLTRRYLTTEPDDTTKNNLLSLPECP
jgi:hypothetical protein